MKVYIVGSGGTCAYAAMYREAGWDIVHNLEDADIVQFTGGEDVSPMLYGENKHPSTHNSEARDEREQKIYHKAEGLGKPMVGICRGGQFLNVMNGGKMWQHVDNHAIGGTHEAFDMKTEKTVQVTSTHHQMIQPHPKKAIIICVAHLSTFKECMPHDSVVQIPAREDIESVYYPETKCLCYQPHPEFNRLAIGDTRDYFFELLDRYILKEVK